MRQFFGAHERFVGSIPIASCHGRLDTSETVQQLVLVKSVAARNDEKGRVSATYRAARSDAEKGGLPDDCVYWADIKYVTSHSHDGAELTSPFAIAAL